MEGLEFSEKLIGHLVTLLAGVAWPIVVGVFLLQQKNPIAKLIDRIKSVKVGKDGATVDIGEQLQQVEAEVAAEKQAHVLAVVEGDAPVAETHGRDVDAPDQRNWIRMSELLTQAPQVVIHQSWTEVRGALYRLLGLEKTAMNWWSLDGLPDEQLVGRAKREGKLKGSLLKATVELMMIYNDAVNTIGWQPTTNQTAEYVKSAGEVADLIMEAAAKLRLQD